MGEGWSDFYALSLLNNTNADDPNGQVRQPAPTPPTSSRGLTRQLPLRHPPLPLHHRQQRQPADLGGRRRRHQRPRRAASRPTRSASTATAAWRSTTSGEIWALTLWEVRSRIIADPAGANGDVPTGNHTMLQLVTDG